MIHVACLLWLQAFAQPDWSRGARLPVEGRPNPYELKSEEIPAAIRAGRLHALHYPVAVTGLLLPEKPVDRFLRADSQDPLKRILQSIAADLTQFHSLEDAQAWLGLIPYPSVEGEGPYFIPFKEGHRPAYRMGYSPIQTTYGDGFSISCAQCHSENLFGRAVMGLTNRFPRANRMFVLGITAAPHIASSDFQWMTDATDGETRLFRQSKAALSRVEARTPAQLGLDTSLAQVALSLARQTGTSADPSIDKVSDSKPAVWWNVKYKNRWLSDGSIVSGNPIFTNFIWNEIGRGTDLSRLEFWLKERGDVVRDLTTAVFSSTPPAFTDFFPPESVDEAQALRGEVIYKARCAHCHGQYEKAWSLPNAAALAKVDRLRTRRVLYPQPTPVIYVGTDPGRYRGMKALEALNDLPISKANGILIERQYGYVPPPLDGIWARWPYFHNNSAPSLCAVLTRTSDRPVVYWARPAQDQIRDFDRRCNGYPMTRTTDELRFDTRKEGLSNRGHDEGIFVREGRELLTPAQKADLIVFLQTL